MRTSSDAETQPQAERRDAETQTPDLEDEGVGFLEPYEELTPHDEEILLDDSDVDDAEGSIDAMEVVDQERRGSGSPAVSATSSSISSIVSVKINQTILSGIDSEKREGKIIISFSRDRANSVLGKKQGDHVTSHRVFIELLSQKLKGAKISEIPSILKESIENIIPDFFEDMDDDMEIPSKASLTRRKFFYPNGTTAYMKRCCELGERADRVGRLNNFLHRVMERYNSLDDVSYVRRKSEGAKGAKGEKGDSEGTITNQSVSALKTISEWVKVSKETDTAESEKQKREIFCKLLSTSGEYVAGAMLLFGANVQAVRVGFGLPGKGFRAEDMHKGVVGTGPGEDLRESFEKFKEVMDSVACNHDLLAQLFNNCFDFAYSAYSSNVSVAPEAEQKRNEDKSSPSKMYELVSRHIAMMSGAFPGIGDSFRSSEELTDQFFNSFISKLLKEQRWENAEPNPPLKLTAEEIKSEIEQEINVRTLCCQKRPARLRPIMSFSSR